MSDVQKLPLFGAVDLDAGHQATIRLTGSITPELIAKESRPPAPAGSGRIVRLAWPLVAIMARIVAGATCQDLDGTKRAIVGLLQEFEQSALGEGVAAREVAAARYTLCTAIDEAVVQTPWGQSSDWSGNSLLATIFAETWGGEKVFLIIDRALADPAAYGELIELCHFVLLLGFQGRYRLVRDGTAQVDAIRDRLLETLRPRLGSLPSLPVPAPATLGRTHLVRFLPIWMMATICLLLASLVFAGLSIDLHRDSRQTAGIIDGLRL
jgi:type VI secretion system protein ImpK